METKKTSKNKHYRLIHYLRMIIRKLEDPKCEEDNEIILLNLIRRTRENECENPFFHAITRERLNDAAKKVENNANPKWTNPFIHWTQYVKWAELIQKLTKM